MKNELNLLQLDLLKTGARKLIIDFNKKIDDLEKSLDILPERCAPAIQSVIKDIEYKISVLNDFIENN